MTNKLTAPRSFLSSVGPSAAAAIITGSVGFLVSTYLGLKDDFKTLAVGCFVFVGSLVVVFVKERVLALSDDLGQRYMEQRTGIAKVYRNLEECKTDMQQDFMKATDVRLLLQIGRRELGDGEPSYFCSVAKKKDRARANIRILRVAEDSPFLSELRAMKRGNRIEQWRADIRRLQEQIELLKFIYNVGIEDRPHSEPYLWRIFLFDDTAYVSGYLYPRDNDRKAFVYKFHKGETSLFTIFNKYFEYLWHKYDTSASSDLIERWANWL